MGRKRKSSGASEPAIGSNGKASSSSRKVIIGAEFMDGHGNLTRSVEVVSLVVEVNISTTVVTENDVSLADAACNTWKTFT